MENYEQLLYPALAPERNAFAFHTFYERLSKGNRNSSLCHWHSEAELIYVEEGELKYLSGGTIYRLPAGSGAFTGPGLPHMTENAGSGDCVWHGFHLDPSILCGGRNTNVYRKYVTPIVWPVPVCCSLDPSIPGWKESLSLLLEAEALNRKATDGYELLITGKLCTLWQLLYAGLLHRRLENTPPVPIARPQRGSAARKQRPAQTVGATDDRWWASEAVADINRMKAALGFIHLHYGEELALQDIANACNAGKADCCGLFKRFLGRTPLSYLVYYRIQMSLPLLEREGLSIAQIAVKLGFHGNSYFAEVFKRVMGCSPSDYRKAHRSASL